MNPVFWWMVGFLIWTVVVVTFVNGTRKISQEAGDDDNEKS